MKNWFALFPILQLYGMASVGGGNSVAFHFRFSSAFSLVWNPHRMPWKHFISPNKPQKHLRRVWNLWHTMHYTHPLRSSIRQVGKRMCSCKTFHNICYQIQSLLIHVFSLWFQKAVISTFVGKKNGVNVYCSKLQWSLREESDSKNHQWGTCAMQALIKTQIVPQCGSLSTPLFAQSTCEQYKWKL